VKQAIHEQVNDPNIEGMGKLLIPMTGMLADDWYEVQ
jgi:hypothetical protein